MENPEYIIPFSKPYLTGQEQTFVAQALSSNGWLKICPYTEQFFGKMFPQSHCFFTNSCSSALEMALKAIKLEDGDQVIIPGFAYVALANAVVNNGGIPVYADVFPDSGNIDINSAKGKITTKTKAIIAIHYAGKPCDIDGLIEICNENEIYFIEDAAQALGSTYKGIPCGNFGHIACISFDYMKNITCAEGGLLIVNDAALLPLVQIVYDNGTNKKQLREGVSSSYEWIGKGNNNHINPLATYVLAAQLEQMEQITADRRLKHLLYREILSDLEKNGQLALPDSCDTNNGHIFYIITKTNEQRNQLRSFLRNMSIYSEHHYSSLSKSYYGKTFFNEDNLVFSDMLSNCLLRLPLWNYIPDEAIYNVCDKIKQYYQQEIREEY